MVLIWGSGCSSQKKLPTHQQIGTHPYGAYIVAVQISTHETKGELIAVDSNQLIILQKHSETCVAIPLNQITVYKIRYARSNNKAWIIPFFTLSTVIHGFIAIITAPLNLIVTSAVIINDRNELSYTHKNISYEQLKMFARFPQGIPDGVKLEDIK